MSNRDKSGRFKKGNKIGPRWKKGQKPSPKAGRPPSIDSPRAQLRRYAEEKAPEKIRKTLEESVPGIDVEDLTWAEAIALVHLVEAVKGDMRAIEMAYKQIDDLGADKHDINDATAAAGAELSARLAKYESVFERLAGAAGSVQDDGPGESVDPTRPASEAG